MTYLTLFLYLLFIVFILVFFFWNTILLQRQKKAWHDFAKKHNLSYRKGTFFKASAVEGNFNKTQIGLFSEGRPDESRRGMMKFSTVIEVVFGHGMPGTGAFSNVDGLRIIQALNFGATYHPDYDAWDKEHIITCSNREFLDVYLNEARLAALNKFLKMKGATALFVFDELDAFLRVETTDPMTDIARIESLVNKLVKLKEDLKLDEAERKKWVPSSIDKIESEAKEPETKAKKEKKKKDKDD